ncbi:hypothetical protein V1264_011238 [Littorina saxatilis]|uniref:2-oxoglutarate and iron-dependent oxygenase JMJD4 n=2 Tax=Littorina saxatilis TaxID=31220 RepID=A0AAN9BTQ8_9CAEN
MSENDTHDYPTISRQTLQSAITEIASQYDSDQKPRQVIPEAVYIDELPDYDEFFAKFLVPNQLGILSEKATSLWKSRREWVCEDGSPDFVFLRQAFGEATVPIADCKCQEFSAHAKQEMKMSEFVTYWQKLREAGYPLGQESLYLKDWHFTRAFSDYEAYSTCPFFRSDWMNEFWDEREDSEDDYRFVYMGPKGTWTPFHSDVFRSFSWSANICGRKRWIFFPPGEEEHLKDIHGNPVYDVMSEELKDPTKFPNAHRVQHRIEIIQHPGETIFVPSGWHHQVHNLEDTISINHNWLNGCNVRRSWLHLVASLEEVQREIGDFSDMEGWDQQCQRILKALSGIDFVEFLRFVESIAKRRITALNMLKNKSTKNEVEECYGSESHISNITSADWRGSREEHIFRDCKDREKKDLEKGEEVEKACSEMTEDRHSLLSAGFQSSHGHHPKENKNKLSRKMTHQHVDASQTSLDEVSANCKHTGGFLPPETLFETAHKQPQISQETQLRQTESAPTAFSTPTQDSHRGLPKQALSALETHNTEHYEHCTMMLDLVDSSCTKAASGSDRRPHWSVCNVNHALFDLASVALVLKHISKTGIYTSASLEVDVSGNEESECLSENSAAVSSTTPYGTCDKQESVSDQGEEKVDGYLEHCTRKEEPENISEAFSKSVSFTDNDKGCPPVQFDVNKELESQNCGVEGDMEAGDSVSTSEETGIGNGESAVDIDSLLSVISQTLRTFDITDIFDCN